jgi:hypothetical protein
MATWVASHMTKSKGLRGNVMPYPNLPTAVWLNNRYRNNLIVQVNPD